MSPGRRGDTGQSEEAKASPCVLRVASPRAPSKGPPRGPPPAVRPLLRAGPGLSSEAPAEAPPAFPPPRRHHPSPRHHLPVRITAPSVPACLAVYLTGPASREGPGGALPRRSVPPRRRSGAPAPPASPLLPAASPDLSALLSCLTVTMFCFAPKVFSRPLVSAQALPRFCAFSRAAPLLPVVILKRQFFRNQPACPSPQCTHRVGPRRTPRLLRTPVTSVLCFLQVARPIGTKA